MNIFKVKHEVLMEELPSSLKETTELTIQAKKVIGALLYWREHSKAAVTKRIIIDNNSLCKMASISKSTLYAVESELVKFNLASRIRGKKRELGQPNVASEWILNFPNLVKPLKKLTFEELYADELNASETEELQPSGTVIQNNINQYKLNQNKSIESNSIEDNLNNKKKETINTISINPKEKTKYSEDDGFDLYMNFIYDIDHGNATLKELYGYKKEIEEEIKRKNLDPQGEHVALLTDILRKNIEKLQGEEPSASTSSHFSKKILEETYLPEYDVFPWDEPVMAKALS